MRSRRQTLVRQEEDSQQQALVFQQQMATANDRISASDNLAREHQARLRVVESEAANRMNRLEGELQDAAASASNIERERELIHARSQLSFLSTQSSRPRQFSPALPDNNVANHPPTPPMSQSAEEQFMSPSDQRPDEAPGAQATDASSPDTLAADIEMLLEDSPPPPPREPRTMTPTGTTSVRRALSWDNQITVYDVPGRSSSVSVVEAQASSSGRSVVEAQASSSGGNASRRSVAPAARSPLPGPNLNDVLEDENDELHKHLNARQKEMEKLRADLQASQDARNDLEQQMHHAQSQLQKLSINSPPQAPTGVESYRISSTDEEDNSQWGYYDDDSDFQDANEPEDFLPPVQKTQDVASNTACSSGGAAQAATSQRSHGTKPFVPRLPLPLVDNSVANSVPQPEVTNAGGKQWVFQNALDNLINEQPRSKQPLIPLRGKPSISIPTQVGVNVPVVVQDGQASYQAGVIPRSSLSATLANIPPPHVTWNNPGSCVGNSSAPAYHPTIKEVDVVVIEPLPAAKHFRHWR